MKTKSLVIAALFAAIPVEARHHRSLKQSLGQAHAPDNNFKEFIDDYFGQPEKEVKGPDATVLRAAAAIKAAQAEVDDDAQA